MLHFEYLIHITQHTLMLFHSLYIYIYIYIYICIYIQRGLYDIYHYIKIKWHIHQCSEALIERNFVATSNLITIGWWMVLKLLSNCISPLCLLSSVIGGCMPTVSLRSCVFGPRGTIVQSLYFFCPLSVPDSKYSHQTSKSCLLQLEHFNNAFAKYYRSRPIETRENTIQLPALIRVGSSKSVLWLGTIGW